jgi:ArsR family transcriptional regulator, arsenate/arsenite/antimonite-responsive transcriptional repressor
MVLKPMDLANALKALSDESRFKLINLLLTHDFCVGALAHHLKITEAAVSQHLKQLREAGLVKGEKRGYWTHYMVDKVKLNELAEGLRNLTKLPLCPEGLCAKNLNPKTDCRKEGEKMCDCKCQHPEKLKAKPEECTPKQIEKCHGSKKTHPCVSKTKKK